MGGIEHYINTMSQDARELTAVLLMISGIVLMLAVNIYAKRNRKITNHYGDYGNYRPLNRVEKVLARLRLI